MKIDTMGLPIKILSLLNGMYVGVWCGCVVWVCGLHRTSPVVQLPILQGIITIDFNEFL
jgi:hypothetical protein